MELRRLLSLLGIALIILGLTGWWLTTRVLDDDGFGDVAAKTVQQQAVRDYIGDQATLQLAQVQQVDHRCATGGSQGDRRGTEFASSYRGRSLLRRRRASPDLPDQQHLPIRCRREQRSREHQGRFAGRRPEAGRQTPGQRAQCDGEYFAEPSGGCCRPSQHMGSVALSSGRHPGRRDPPARPREGQGAGAGDPVHRLHHGPCGRTADRAGYRHPTVRGISGRAPTPAEGQPLPRSSRYCSAAWSEPAGPCR